MTAATSGGWVADHIAFIACLGLYVAFRVVLAAGRRAARGPREREGDPRPEIGALGLAMISGGPQLAITTAAAKLHRDGALAGGASARTLVGAGPLDAHAEPLEREIHELVTGQPGIAMKAMRANVARGMALRQLTTELSEAGLLVGRDARRRMRLLWLLGPVVIAFNVMSIGLGWHPAGWALGATVFLVMFLLMDLIGALGPRVTRRAHEFVLAERKRLPALRTYPSAADRPLAVALFGGAVLWSSDPAMATALGCPRELHTSSGSAGGCGGGGGWGEAGGGEGGDGGGGCGGGCGG